ncbi:MAG: hypothetical protein JOZ18_20205 [Chloroflexi bacterium]|nr:hypothetical protein [Chloroflexota bacterium]
MPPLQNTSYSPSYQAAPPYQAIPINYPPASSFTVSNKNDSALIAEIILSLFGIFGVGWLMAGETTVGIILLVCSIVLYWPIVLVGTVATIGVGLICLGPLAIGAIILNALLLNNLLKRKAAQFVVMPPPPMPPQY